MRSVFPSPNASQRWIAASVMAIAPLAAQAQASGADKWQGELGIYGWFPAIGGSTSFPTGASGPSLDVSAQDVIDALKMVFMGNLELRKGRWGLFTDIVYADLGASRGGTHEFTIAGKPVTTTANLSLDVKTTVWSLSGLYGLASTPEYRADLLFGARLLDMQQTLQYDLAAVPPQHPGLAKSGKLQVDGSNWDAVVGLKGRIYLGAERKWFLPYYVDVGAGESKLTWQVNAGVGYQFSWGSAFATWRYLDYDFKSGNALQSFDLNGGLIGVAFQF
jgi:hypothetical protein